MNYLVSTYEAAQESSKPGLPCCRDLNDAMDPISRKIMDFRAVTLAGLAVKARVAQHCCSHYWDESYRDCDFDQLMARQLIESVLAAGAVS